MPTHKKVIPVLGIRINVQKAFDSVKNNRLYLCGIRDNTLNLIKNVYSQ